MIDLPFALPTIVAGLTLLALYGPREPDRRQRRLHAPRRAAGAAVRDAAVRRPHRAAGADRARPRDGGGRRLARRRPPGDLPRESSSRTSSRRSSPASRSPSRGRSGEFGAVVLISGNIPFDTEVVLGLHLQPDRERQRDGSRGRVGRPARDLVRGAARDRRHPALGDEARWLRYLLRFVAIGYVSALLLIPLAIVFRRAFGDGLDAAWEAVTTPAALHAFWLTILIARSPCRANTIFGDALRARDRAAPLPRARAGEQRRRPAARALPRRRRARAPARSTAARAGSAAG